MLDVFFQHLDCVVFFVVARQLSVSNGFDLQVWHRDYKREKFIFFDIKFTFYTCKSIPFGGFLSFK